MRLYPFSLAFNGNAAFFPFMFDGVPVEGFSCILSSRAAGDMGIRETERRNVFLQALGIDPLLVRACTQTHSRKVLVADERGLPEADGLISAGVYLSVTVADCLPVYLLDTETATFALVHSGWKGTGIVLDALALMKARPETVTAVLGPCICVDCYHVDEDRRRQFEDAFGGSGGAYPLGPLVKGNALNLQAANARLLANAGVRNIAVCDNCTFTDERLGSFRREGAHFTRMLALAGKRL